MCYKNPGPRCSSHAKEACRKARDRWVDASKGHGKDSDQANTAFIEYMHKRGIYDSTPAGQKTLSRKAHELRKKVDELTRFRDRKEREQCSAELALLDERRRKGREMRTLQMAQYRLAQVEAGDSAASDMPTYGLHPRWEENHALDSSWVTSSGDEIRVYDKSDERESRSRDQTRCAWRLRNGEPVAMVEFIVAGRSYDDNVICDVEVNPVYRGEQLGADTLRELGLQYGELHSGGSFSQSGHRSLGGKSPMLAGGSVYVSKGMSHYEFVDWDTGDLKPN